MEQEPILQYEIRKGTVDDVVAARQMHAESWLATYPNEEQGVSYEWVKERTDGWFSEDGMKRSREIISRVIDNPDHFYRLATDGDQVKGMVHVANNDNGTKELEAIYTSPETFGTGLGQKLMDEATEWIGDADTTLSVVTYNERAIRFYEKNGFEIVPGSESLFKDKMPIVRMIRKGENDV